MGLDTSHNCWHGPYSAFKRFREAVADAAKEHRGYEPSYDGHPFRAFMGWWDFSHDYEREPDHHPYADPLDVFFVHSDCDGWIFPGDADVLADNLEPLLGYMSTDELDWAVHRDRLREFIEGLRSARDNWEPVAFR